MIKQHKFFLKGARQLGLPKFRTMDQPINNLQLGHTHVLACASCITRGLAHTIYARTKAGLRQDRVRRFPW